MGDYGFGVLVQNNTGNKSAFPVRFHPHLQPPHHHQNATPSPAAFINNNTAANGSSAGSAWLFPAPAAHNIQDEILGSEKSKTQQQEKQDSLEKQQLSPSQSQEAGMLSEPEKAKTEENQGDNSSENGNGKEKIRIESPVLTAFDYQEASGLGTSTQPLTSTASSLTGFSNWSAAIAPSSSTIINEDASFFHQGGVPTASANNGALLFQNFPHHVSPGFGGSFSPQIGPLSQHHPHHPHFQHHHNQHQQQRRSPASPHPPPFTHRNAAFNQLPHLANNLNKPPSPWSSYQSPSPTPSSWSPGGGGYGGWGGSQGRDHRRGLNGGITPLNSISPLKKNFASNHIQLQKYARPSSAFAPKSWMEDSLNRADNIFPFQDRTRTFDMHSLENSLIDIMRAENDSLKAAISICYFYPHE
ncbi:cytoplasmic polyadenylation element-binding protein 4 isoform X6 [Apteryx mantelli]|uniref:Cytoplasmic polyadenylation element-binding protein 4 isoform X6 n=1 Tax=Apteryx mantelli TaxID=2696672 RepID=A0ABM4F835_9AVES